MLRRRPTSALAHPKVTAAVKKRLRDQYRSLDPVALLAEIRATQEELGNRVDRRAGQARGPATCRKSTAPQPVQPSTPDTVAFAKTLGTTVEVGDPRATHRRPTRLIRRGFACRPSSTRTSPRSRTGLPASVWIRSERRRRCRRDQPCPPQQKRAHEDLAQIGVCLHDLQQLLVIDLDDFACFAGADGKDCSPT